MSASPSDITRSQVQRQIAEAIAVEVVELVRAELGLRPGEEDWIDSKEVARRFGLSRAWVYAHAGRLGGVRIGTGPRPRLRFVPSLVAEALRLEAAPAPPTVERDDPPGSAIPVHVPRIRPLERNRQ